MDELKFTLEYRHDTWYLTGQTIVGFWLWGPDIEKLAKDIVPTVNYLIKHQKLDLPRLDSNRQTSAAGDEDR